MRKGLLALLLFALFSPIGCSDKVDIWTPRLGSFSYDEAVNLYGQPTACQDLENGDRLCGWYSSGRSGWSDRSMLLFDQYGILKEVPVAGDLE